MGILAGLGVISPRNVSSLLAWYQRNHPEIAGSRRFSAGPDPYKPFAEIRDAGAITQIYERRAFQTVSFPEHDHKRVVPATFKYPDSVKQYLLA